MRILITGMSGVGKTTTLAELQKRGYLVIDIDATGLCKWKNKATGEIVKYGPMGRDDKWLAEHGWYCDLEKFKLLLSSIEDAKFVFIAGLTENIQEFSKEFDKVFILDTHDDTVEKRLIERTNNHFAKNENERAFIFKSQRELLTKLQNPIHIDTHHSPEIVAQEILDSLSI